jgi:hypothetical protein
MWTRRTNILGIHFSDHIFYSGGLLAVCHIYSFVADIMVDLRAQESQAQQQPVRSGARQSRIPATLQAVFLASNRGKTVEGPPPEQVANRTFFRHWFLQKQTKSSKKDSSMKVKKNKRDDISSNPVQGSETSMNTLFVKYLTFRKNVILESKSQLPIPLKELEEGPTVSPQAFLDTMISARGYSTARFETLHTAYYNMPTPLQQASYDVYLIEVVKKGGIETLRSLMKSGISPNPCNKFGESLLHTVCRLGNVDALRVMLECGTSLQVSDDYGRTPLHDACWAVKPALTVVDVILSHDPNLLYLEDSRGALPLSYIRREHWCAWIPYFRARKDMYWPDLSGHGMPPREQSPPALFMERPFSAPLPDPANALTCELAKLVASRQMLPGEAQFLKYSMMEEEGSYRSDTESEAFEGSDDDESGSDSELDSDEFDEDEDGSYYSLEEDEMADILSTLTARAVPSKEDKTATGQQKYLFSHTSTPRNDTVPLLKVCVRGL